MLSNIQAIEYIESLQQHYYNSNIRDERNPNYRYCGMWISAQDMAAFNMAKDALLERDCYVKVLHDASDETSAKILRAKDNTPLTKAIVSDNIGTPDTYF